MHQIAVFGNVSQCLHVSFLMEFLPVSQLSFMQKMIEDHMKALGIWNESKSSDRTMNFGSLSPLEIRGQCAMVRATVADHLSEDQKGVVYARYSYQTPKSRGVRTVRDYAAPGLATKADMPTLAMAWNIFGTVAQQAGLSVREIAREYAIPETTVHRDIVKIRKAATMLEGEAVQVLGDLFVRTNLVDAV